MSDFPTGSIGEFIFWIIGTILICFVLTCIGFGMAEGIWILSNLLR